MSREMSVRVRVGGSTNSPARMSGEPTSKRRVKPNLVLKRNRGLRSYLVDAVEGKWNFRGAIPDVAWKPNFPVDIGDVRVPSLDRGIERHHGRIV